MGSPGVARMRKNRSTAATASVTTPCATRPASQRATLARYARAGGRAGGSNGVAREVARKLVAAPHGPAPQVEPRRLGPDRRVLEAAVHHVDRRRREEERGGRVGLDPLERGA